MSHFGKNIITIKGGKQHEELFQKIRLEAEKERRSLNNLILLILENHFKAK